VNPFYYQ